MVQLEERDRFLDLAGEAARQRQLRVLLRKFREIIGIFLDNLAQFCECCFLHLLELCLPLLLVRRRHKLALHIFGDYLLGLDLCGPYNVEVTVTGVGVATASAGLPTGLHCGL